MTSEPSPNESQTTSDAKFPASSIVLAKVKGFPPWPAMVLKENILPDYILDKKPKNVKQVTQKKTITIVPVRFFSDDTYIWIKDVDLKPLEESQIAKYLDKGEKRRDNLLKKAYELAQNPPSLEDFVKYGSIGKEAYEANLLKLAQEEKEKQEKQEKSKKKLKKGSKKNQKTNNKVNDDENNMESEIELEDDIEDITDEPDDNDDDDDDDEYEEGKPSTSRKRTKSKSARQPAKKKTKATVESKATKPPVKAKTVKETAKDRRKREQDEAKKEALLKKEQEKEKQLEINSGYDSDWGIDIDYNREQGDYIFDDEDEQDKFEKNLPNVLELSKENEVYVEQSNSIKSKLQSLLFIEDFKKEQQNITDDKVYDKPKYKTDEIIKELKKLQSLDIPISIIRSSEILKMLIIVMRRPIELFKQDKIRKLISKYLETNFDLTIRPNEMDEISLPTPEADTNPGPQSQSPNVDAEVKNGLEGVHK